MNFTDAPAADLRALVVELAGDLAPMHTPRHVTVRWSEYAPSGKEVGWHVDGVAAVGWPALHDALGRLAPKRGTRIGITELTIVLDTMAIDDGERWADSSAHLKLEPTPAHAPASLLVTYVNGADAWLAVTYDHNNELVDNRAVASANRPRLATLLAALASRWGTARPSSQYYGSAITPDGYRDVEEPEGETWTSRADELAEALGAQRAEVVEAYAKRIEGVGHRRLEGRLGSCTALLREFLRRAAHCAELVHAEARRPFLDFARALDPRSLAVSVIGLPLWEDLIFVAEWVVRWQALPTEVRDRHVDPWEPLVLFFERGGVFLVQGTTLELGDVTMEEVNTLPIDDYRTYLKLEPLDLAPEHLNALDLRSAT